MGPWDEPDRWDRDDGDWPDPPDEPPWHFNSPEFAEWADMLAMRYDPTDPDEVRDVEEERHAAAAFVAH